MNKQLYLEAIDTLRQRVEAAGEGELDRLIIVDRNEALKDPAEYLLSQAFLALRAWVLFRSSGDGAPQVTPSTTPPPDDLRADTWHTFATIRPESERAAWWLEVFGGDRCPVKSILPQRGNLPGKPDALFYEMDIAALTPEQRGRLVQSLAKRFGYILTLVEFSLDNYGCPVLADDVVVSTTNVGLLLPDAPTSDAWDWIAVSPDGDDWEDDAPGIAFALSQLEEDEEWDEVDTLSEANSAGMGLAGEDEDYSDLWEADEALEYAPEGDGEDTESGV